jgi:aryl-phospho-beta-D-glucosidase BglC (GH1 family)
MKMKRRALPREAPRKESATGISRMIRRHGLLTTVFLVLGFIGTPALSDVIKLTDGRLFNVTIIRESEAGVTVRYNDQEFVVAPDHYVWARPTPYRLTVRGRKVLAPGGAPVVLRGFNVWSCDPHTRSDFERMKQLGANHVRIAVFQDWEGISDRGGPGQPLSDRTIEKLDQFIDWCEELEIWVVFSVASHRHHKGMAGDLYAPAGMHSLRRDEFDEVWRMLIERYKDRWFIGMYDIINEVDQVPPHLTQTSLSTWYKSRIERIRKVDPLTPVVVSSTGWGNIDEVGDNLRLHGIGNIVYSFHYYSPRDATDHKEPHFDLSGKMVKTKDGRRTFPLGPGYHAYHFDKAASFSRKFEVPIYVGEFGCWKLKPHSTSWIKDVTTTAEERGFHWAFFCWRGAYGYGVIWTGDNRTFYENTDLLTYFNSVMPSRMLTTSSTKTRGKMLAR